MPLVASGIAGAVSGSFLAYRVSANVPRIQEHQNPRGRESRMKSHGVTTGERVEPMNEAGKSMTYD